MVLTNILSKFQGQKLPSQFYYCPKTKPLFILFIFTAFNPFAKIDENTKHCTAQGLFPHVNQSNIFTFYVHLNDSIVKSVDIRLSKTDVLKRPIHCRRVSFCMANFDATPCVYIR